MEGLCGVSRAIAVKGVACDVLDVDAVVLAARAAVVVLAAGFATEEARAARCAASSSSLSRISRISRSTIVSCFVD